MISTHRLSLVEATLQDSAFIYKLLNSPHWIEHIGDRGIDSDEKATAYIRDHLINSYKANSFGLFKVVLMVDGRPIGLCGILKRSYLPHPDIGYAILPEFEGYGYISEAVQATLDFAQEELKLKTLMAITTDKNGASRHLLEKIGFERVINYQYQADYEELLYEINF